MPDVAAIVDLAEGSRMMTNVVEADPVRLEVGIAVEVTFQKISDEVTLPVFHPAS